MRLDAICHLVCLSRVELNAVAACPENHHAIMRVECHAIHSVILVFDSAQYCEVFRIPEDQALIV